jgi:hypothetical protein
VRFELHRPLAPARECAVSWPRSASLPRTPCFLQGAASRRRDLQVLNVIGLGFRCGVSGFGFSVGFKVEGVYFDNGSKGLLGGRGLGSRSLGFLGARVQVFGSFRGWSSGARLRGRTVAVSATAGLGGGAASRRFGPGVRVSPGDDTVANPAAPILAFGAGGWGGGERAGGAALGRAALNERTGGGEGGGESGHYKRCERRGEKMCCVPAVEGSGSAGELHKELRKGRPSSRLLPRARQTANRISA